jgi:hypothetical protein
VTLADQHGVWKVAKADTATVLRRVAVPSVLPGDGVVVEV